MSFKPIYLGKVEANFKPQKVEGSYVDIEGDSYYKIANSNNLRPFFMSIVSDSNHWLFISSNGGISAGRKDRDLALFPYYTDDKITESTEITGSKTILQIHTKNKIFLWEPFSDRYEGIYNINRNLYKNSLGNKIIFEEINHDLGLTYSYQWSSSNKFGFVKKATLINNTKEIIKVTLVDGIQNILPYGISAELQNSKSNLVDAYKKSELEAEIGLGIYKLSAIIVDKAEPSEALKTNIAWSIGLETPKHLISSLQLNDFRKGISLKQEKDIKAEKGAYFVSTDLNLLPQNKKSWLIVANVNQGSSAVVEMINLLKSDVNLKSQIINDIELGSKNLIDLVATADGLQITSDNLRSSRHFSNTLFNIMRGGVFDDNYQIDSADFIKYISKANKNVYTQNKKFLEQLPEIFSKNILTDAVVEIANSDFKRLVLEYLPLKFSRRHGDPSRPWNKFAIQTRSEIDGSKILNYEGNWRDIFQNWETLGHSYPEFLESMIHKFLNASTFEGYNPYRITKDGFDWEVIDPNDPWSYIGYWGDHQIIYLLKFLENFENHYPNKLTQNLSEEIFVYANVPYKIKSYKETLKNPKDTIVFDADLDKKISERKKQIGADGALLLSKDNRIYNVNLLEKLLATVLSKCANFIPETGIWMNTQRPEWNDANNALVGNGVSMVTLYYLRRFISFFKSIIQKSENEFILVSAEMETFFSSLHKSFLKFKKSLASNISDTDRKNIADELGNAGSDYRNTVYNEGFSDTRKAISKTRLLSFFDISLQFLEHAIDCNKRKDNLYHAYNLITLESEHKITIAHLPEMLEGQVAVLSSGYLSVPESLKLLDNLKNSALFRPDQYSYLLYPNKELLRFVDKNNIPKESVEKSVLFKQLLKEGNTQIIEKDVEGNCHFNGNFNNAQSLNEALYKLPEKFKTLIEEDTEFVFSVFEDMFDHKSFTGRSGTFYGYEGLGSIYWHMVSKLLLAVQETCINAINTKENKELIGRLLEHYYEINEGIGVHKSPKLYGAFPTDPYSHTPAEKGAQQPGMTGQVKEDILSRFGELGVFVKDGSLQFKPSLLRREEFLKASISFKYTDVNNDLKEIELKKESLCFTYCQIPIIYNLSDKEGLSVIFKNGEKRDSSNLNIDEKTSKQIFERAGVVAQILVSLDKNGF
ncbi:MAG: hypothetical protein HQ471_09565 [Flavobacteriales bacterium]|nr:hypothetical protein [Flavobacteriales bacterium]